MKPNGNMVLGGFHCKESITLYAMAKNGAVLEFSSENAPLSDRKSIGKHVVSLDKQDVIVDLMIKP
ncbi:hypothetical protein D3C76_1749170 [compost metagenome]